MVRRPTAQLLPTRVGSPPHRVWVGVRPEKKGVVYLRWRRGNNWAWKSLRFTLEGKTAAERAGLEAKAYEAAMDQYQRLSGKRAPAAQRARKPLTLADAWEVLTNPTHGRYPTDTTYRRELHHALAEAARTLGKDFAFVAFDRGRLREVTRARADRVMRNQGVGFRAAQMLGTRLLTILRVLQEEGHLPDDLPIPGGRAWHAELRAYCVAQRGDELPATHRPRYTLDEFRALIAAAPDVDPRFGLMMALGAELRPGQVARARRSHVDLAAEEVTVHGRGKKSGTTIKLTAGQLRALVAALEPPGYLAPLEAEYVTRGTDYLLFPSVLGPGRVARDAAHLRPVRKEGIVAWVRSAEARAGIPHHAGRSWYGGRRQSVDAALDAGIGTDALEGFGGWIDPRTPTKVYRDRGRQTAKDEAARIRSQVRGETSEEGTP